MAVNLRRQMTTQWPVVIVVVLVIVLVGAVASSHLSKSMALALGAAIPALVVLMRTKRETTLQICLCGAAFFSAAWLKLGGRINISDVFLLLAVGMIILKPSDRPMAPVPRALFAGLMLVIAGGLVGALFRPSQSPFSEPNGIFTPVPLFGLPPPLAEVVRFTYGTIGVVTIVRFCRFTRVETRRVLIAYVVGATASVIWGLSTGPGNFDRARGLTPHPVVFGWISALTAVIGIGLFLVKQPAIRRVGVVAIVFGLIGTSQSGTRSALVLFLAGFVLVLLGMRNMRRTSQFLLLGGLAVAIGLTGATGDSPVAARLQGNQSATASDTGRAHIQQESVALVRDHGITGIGLPYLYPPHNLILGILGSTGILGLAGLLVVVLALARRLIGVDPNDTMAIGVLAAVLAVYVSSWIVNVGWGEWFWVPLALGLTLPPLPRKTQAEADASAPMELGTA